MKIISKPEASDYTPFSVVIKGYDTAKDQAVHLYKSLVRDGNFQPDDLAIIHSPNNRFWWVAQTKSSVKKKIKNMRVEVRNPVGHRIPRLNKLTA